MSATHLEMNLVGFDKRGNPYLFRSMPEEVECERREWIMCYWDNETFLAPAKIHLPGQRGAQWLDPLTHARLKIWACNGEGNNYFFVGTGKPERAHFCRLNKKVIIVDPQLLLERELPKKGKK